MVTARSDEEFCAWNCILFHFLLLKQACKETELFEPYSYRKNTVSWLCYLSHCPSFSPLPLSFVDEGCFLLSIFLERVAHCLRCDNSSSASSRRQPSGMDIQKGSLSSLSADIWPDSTGWNRQWGNFFPPNLAIFECTLLDWSIELLPRIALFKNLCPTGQSLHVAVTQIVYLQRDNGHCGVTLKHKGWPYLDKLSEIHKDLQF